MFNILDHKENANQNDIDSISWQSKWLSITQRTTNAGKDGGKRNPHTLLMGM
jgi:hypothetical protein